jgi:hypothetical protein
MKYKTIACLSFFAALILSSTVATACDLCSIYTALDTNKHTAGTTHIGLAEQFTSFDELRDNGRKVDNVADQFMRSSITQFFVAHDLTEEFSLQLNLPLIYRSYRRMEEGARESGHESGLGDLVLLSRFRPIDMHETDYTFRLELFGGIKLPTGDSDRLREELAEEEEGEHADLALQNIFKHEGHHHEDEIASAVHGHDLALGSGSVDFPVGASVLGRYGRALATANVQYIFRTEGRFDYRYANDLNWDTGIGGFLALDHDYSIGLKVNLSGEYKPEDKHDGESLSDTYTKTLFIGPEVFLTLGESLSLSTALDLPLDIENKSLQVAQTSRLRFALTYRL